MQRDFLRSKKTNKLTELLVTKYKLGFEITFPGMGVVRLHEDSLQELLWILRSSKVEELLPRWIDKCSTFILAARSGSKVRRNYHEVVAQQDGGAL